MEQRLGPAASWDKEYWFQRVLCSKYNSTGAAASVAKQLAQQPPLPPWRVLFCYHRLLRNAIAQDFDDELQVRPTQPMPPFAADDVDLVVSWPITSSLQETVSVLQPVVSAAQSAARLSCTPSSSSTASSTVSTSSEPSGSASQSDIEPSVQSSSTAPAAARRAGRAVGARVLLQKSLHRERGARRESAVSWRAHNPYMLSVECMEVGCPAAPGCTAGHHQAAAAWRGSHASACRAKL